MIGVRGISMDIWESLKTMEVPPLDPKDIISEVSDRTKKPEKIVIEYNHEDK